MQLSQAEITQQNNQKYLISGVVDFMTTPELMLSAARLLISGAKAAEKKVLVDMSQVTDCNSAGLALMLEMEKQARASKIDLHFENIPDTLLTIAKAYGVENEIRDICK